MAAEGKDSGGLDGLKRVRGDDFITDDSSEAFAAAMLEEAEVLLHSEGWKLHKAFKNGLRVEFAPVEGSKLMVTRGAKDLPMSAAHVLEFVSDRRRGYKAIDPACEHQDPVKVYKSAKGSLELYYSLAKFAVPGVSNRDFVTLNHVIPEKGLFLSKSCQHAEWPRKDKPYRALNTFAMRVEPLEDGKCRLWTINYIDMGGKASAWSQNFIAVKLFLPGMYARVEKALQKELRSTLLQERPAKGEVVPNEASKAVAKPTHANAPATVAVAAQAVLVAA